MWNTQSARTLPFDPRTERFDWIIRVLEKHAPLFLTFPVKTTWTVLEKYFLQTI